MSHYYFYLKDFNEEVVQGYLKLVEMTEGLCLEVIDTYNGETIEQEKVILR